MNDAIELMLGIYRTPARSSQLCYRELPADLLDVVRIAAGDSRSLRRGQAITGLDDSALHDAATLLLQQLLFYDGADGYRVLGVAPGASTEQIKRHHRWLMRWLHPDRDPSNEHSVYSERVNSAWNRVRTEERRANYDIALASGAVDESPRASTHGEPSRARFDGGHVPWVSGRLVRRLPQFVVAMSTIVIGAAALVAFVWSREDDADLLNIHEFDATAAVARDDDVTGRVLWRAPATSAFGELDTSTPARADVPATATIDATETSVAVPTARAATLPVASDVGPVAVVTAAPAPRAEVPVRNREASVLATASTRRAIAPVSTTTRAAAKFDATTMPAVALSEDELRAIVIRFQALYASDDVDDFLRLFAEDARTDSGGIDAIRDDYRRLFHGREFRRMRLIDMRWDIRGTQAVGRGRYEARVGSSADATPISTRGNIEIVLRRTDDGLRITRLQHDIVDERG